MESGIWFYYLLVHLSHIGECVRYHSGSMQLWWNWHSMRPRVNCQFAVKELVRSRHTRLMAINFGSPEQAPSSYATLSLSVTYACMQYLLYILSLFPWAVHIFTTQTRICYPFGICRVLLTFTFLFCQFLFYMQSILEFLGSRNFGNLSWYHLIL